MSGKVAVLGSISYLGQLQDPSQRPPHIPQLGMAQPLPVLQLIQVLQAPLATVPARLRQPCRTAQLGQGVPSSQPCHPHLPPTLIFPLPSSTDEHQQHPANFF